MYRQSKNKLKKKTLHILKTDAGKLNLLLKLKYFMAEAVHLFLATTTQEEIKLQQLGNILSVCYSFIKATNCHIVTYKLRG